jgi:hypothetical protein
VKPLEETFASPVSAKLFTAPCCSDEIGVPASALAVEFNVQSDEANGQTADGAHSATRPRPSALVALFTDSFNVAPVTVAPAGNPDVSNRKSGTYTPYLPNANRRATVNVCPLKTAGVPDGGYPADCDALKSSSPSSAPDANDTVNVPDCAAAATTPVCADVADAEPTLFDAVTTTCTLDPTSPDDNKYVA